VAWAGLAQGMTGTGTHAIASEAPSRVDGAMFGACR
jgi:hypothetical protein